MQEPSKVQPLQNVLLQEAEAFAVQLLQDQEEKGFVYHNIEHTREVVQNCIEIGTKTELSDAEMETLLLAAWFHDLGYTTTYRGHEDESKAMARSFMTERSMGEEQIAQVLETIEATKLDHVPHSVLENVIKDADLYNLGTPEAFDNSQKLREEWAHFLHQEYSEESWAELNYNFFKEYRFFTDYAQETLTEQKDKNVKKLKKQLKKLRSQDQIQEELRAELEKKDRQLEKLQGKLILKPDRGIETMFRTTLRNQLNLSAIADNKANILISISSIMISVVFSMLFSKLENNRHLIVPTLILLTVCVVTIVFSVLATRPKVDEGKFSRKDIENKRTNLMFFGNFHNTDLNDYIWGMKEMMKDAEYLYSSMIKDIYFHGKVLAKKFRLLRIAYTLFMIGMSVAVASFGIVLWLYPSGLDQDDKAEKDAKKKSAKEAQMESNAGAMLDIPVLRYKG